MTTENSDRYYQDFGGTSAAAPIVSGVAALTRDANPDLTWRDVKLILAATAQKNDPASPGWKDGASKHPISSTDRYSLQPRIRVRCGQRSRAPSIWPSNGRICLPLNLRRQCGRILLRRRDSRCSCHRRIVDIHPHTHTGHRDRVHRVRRGHVLAFDHDSFRDLEILYWSRRPEPFRDWRFPLTPTTAFNVIFGRRLYATLHGAFQFGSAKHLGEDPNGEWKLHVTDRIPVVDGTFVAFGITVYGHERAPGVTALDSVEGPSRRRDARRCLDRSRRDRRF